MFKIDKSKLSGCIELTPTIFSDHRGKMIKPFNVELFDKLNICTTFIEDLVVFCNKNVLRGLHFQSPPFAQSKLVCCIEGAIVDVIVDIRKNSPTFGEFEIFNLNDKKMNMLYIPEGFAHGYYALCDKNIVLYKLSTNYSPGHDDGLLWDSLNIPWGVDSPNISKKDMELTRFCDFISPF